MSSTESGAQVLEERTHGAGGTAQASVVLPIAVDVPARYAVPVEVRSADRSLFGRFPADGRYHAAPAGDVTFIAHLPDGRVFQTSTNLAGGASARITLQGDTRPRERAPAGATPLEHQRTALRFYVQSSLDSAKRSRRTSLASTLLESADELRLELTKHATGVQFLQLTAPGAFPMNVACASGAGVKLVRLDQRLAADILVLDERVELALDYLHRGRVQEAATTLDLQGVSLHDAERADDVTTAVVLLFILLATSEEERQLSEVELSARRLADRHPDVSDFRVIAAECAALLRRDGDALAQLTELQRAGLPLLNRSFVRAMRRLSDHASTGFEAAASEHRGTLAAIFDRLRELAPYVDPASRMLVVAGRAPDAPGEAPFWRRVGAPFKRFVSEHGIVKSDPKGREAPMAVTGVDPAAAAAGETKKDEAGGGQVTTPAPPTKLALIAAGVALLVWVGMAIFLLANTGDSDTQWTRAAWVFTSIEAVAFAAAGLLFGATVNRQRAEQAEKKATENQKDAEGGRALAATLKADEPAVVHEGGGAEGAPQAQGGRGRGAGEDAAAQVAARHARLARQFFP